MMRSRVKRRLLEIALVVAVLAAVAMSYAGTTKLSWMYDDAFLLRVVTHADLNDYFGSRPFWRSMPAKMFVPLLLVWYEAGSRAGSEAGFYALAILLLVAALAASYVALRRFLDPVASLTAIALIGLGVPTIAVVTQLMATHYLLALALCALSVWCYAREGAMLSALFYLAAMLAKEIAVPLPLVLWLLPRAKRNVVPHGIALLLYFAWRRIMIGTFLGGYGWAVTRETVGPLLRDLPRQFGDATSPPNLAIAILVALALLIPIALRMRSRNFAVAAILTLGAAIGPVLPVARELQPRYAFAAWVTLAVLFAIASRGNAIVCAIAVAIVGLAHASEWSAIYPLAERMSAEARFVSSAPPEATLRLPKTPPAAIAELANLRGSRARWFYDDIYLCSGRDAGRRVFEYSDACDCIRPIDVTAIAAKHCNSVRNDVPLRADFRFERGTLSWTFGPYEQGRWSVVFADGIQAFAVPRNDAYILGDLPGIALRVRYDAPEGWVTYSPELALDFVHRPNSSWHR